MTRTAVEAIKVKGETGEFLNGHAVDMIQDDVNRSIVLIHNDPMQTIHFLSYLCKRFGLYIIVVLIDDSETDSQIS